MFDKQIVNKHSLCTVLREFCVSVSVFIFTFSVLHCDNYYEFFGPPGHIWGQNPRHFVIRIIGSNEAILSGFAVIRFSNGFETLFFHSHCCVSGILLSYSIYPARAVSNINLDTGGKFLCQVSIKCVVCKNTTQGMYPTFRRLF